MSKVDFETQLVKFRYLLAKNSCNRAITGQFFQLRMCLKPFVGRAPPRPTRELTALPQTSQLDYQRGLLEADGEREGERVEGGK